MEALPSEREKGVKRKSKRGKAARSAWLAFAATLKYLDLAANEKWCSTVCA